MDPADRKTEPLHDANGSVIRWCFADPLLAEGFARRSKA